MDGATKVVGNRVGAFLIDLLIMGVVWGIIFMILAKKVDGVVDIGDNGAKVDFGHTTYYVTGSDQNALLLCSLVFWILYTWILPGRTGWTLGKLICQVRVVNVEGKVAGVGRNAIRQILWIVDYFPYFIPALTGFIVALTSKNNQRVGDMVASTYVVKKEAFGLPVLGDSSNPPAEPVTTSTGIPADTPAQTTAAVPSVPGATTPTPPPPDPVAQPNPPANWYPDPKGESRLRYWDGSKWTEHIAE